jgi:hypothetical protein
MILPTNREQRSAGHDALQKLNAECTTPWTYPEMFSVLKRVAIFQIRSPRFSSLFLRMSLSRSR